MQNTIRHMKELQPRGSGGVGDLHGQGIASMAASVDDVERWDWQDLQRTHCTSDAAWLLLPVLLTSAALVLPQIVCNRTDKFTHMNRIHQASSGN